MLINLGNKPEWLRKKRWAKELAKRVKKRMRISGPKHIFCKWSFKSAVLNVLRITLINRPIPKKVIISEYPGIFIPKKFSLIDETDSTLEVVDRLVSYSFNIQQIIIIDYSQCEMMDLGASSLMDVICMEFKAEQIRAFVNHQKNSKYFKIQGPLPKDERIKTFLKATGLLRHLKIRNQKTTAEEEQRFVRFPLRKGTKISEERKLTRTNDGERAATDFSEYLDGCFQKAADYRLTVEGKRLIHKWIGEITDNAEDHSGEKDWFIIGYMTPSLKSPGEHFENESDGIGYCEISCFNFGRTIFESLQAGPDSLLKQLKGISVLHSSKGFFGPQFTEENLWTLYSLQDGVSRHTPEPGKTDRGKGTVKMIKTFQKLGNTNNPLMNPSMVLVSGKTKILFDQQYEMKDQLFDGEKRGVIAFNKENDLHLPPDKKNVGCINGFFPGTILTFRFYIEKAYLSKIIPSAHQ